MIFAIFVLLLFLGCNKEMETFQPGNDITIENEMLVFKSSEILYKTLGMLDSMSNEEMEAWLVDLGFHNSLYFQFKEMEDCEAYSSDESLLTPNDVRDRSFSALLNCDGLISVGDTLSLVQKNVEHVITNGDLSMIQKIKKNPEKEFGNVIKNYPHTNLKSSFGIGHGCMFYPGNVYYLECEVWLEIWFWTHSSYAEIDLLPVCDDLWDFSRQEMSYSVLHASGQYASDNDGIDPEYTTYSVNNYMYSGYVNQKQIYRKTGQSGWLCAKNIVLSGVVYKKGDSEGVDYNISFPTAWCANSGL